MPTVRTTQVLQLGSHRDLDPLEWLGGAERADDLLNQTFGSATDPLWNEKTAFTMNDGNDDGSIPFVNHVIFPTDEYITVNGQNVSVDTGVAYNATFVYSDGTTGTGVVRILQDGAGNLYLLPPPRDAPTAEVEALTGKPIQSFTITSVSSNNYASLGSDRFGLPDDPTFPCFCKGTMILTESGEKPVEDLKVGDLIVTVGNGLQPVRWIGSRHLDASHLSAHKKLIPVRIKAGALGENTPASDLLVSPQHRVLVRSRIAEKMFGSREVLVAAKQLVLCDGVDFATELDEVEYFHILFDRHEVIVTNGAETESLYTGPEALETISLEMREEIFSLFPELRDREYVPSSARPLVSGRMARRLSARHVQNKKPLVAVAKVL